MLKRALILVFADVILIVSWLWWEQPDPSVSIIAVIIVPALVILNLISGIVLFLFKKKQISNAFFLNSVLSVIVFSLLFDAWYAYRRWMTYEIFTFKSGVAIFEISLDKNDRGFDISDVTRKSEGSTIGYMFGDYEVRNDTIFLNDIEGVKKCFIHNKRIYNFAGVTEGIPITKD